MGFVFSSRQDPNSEEPEMTDWEKYAAEEYEILVAEEGGGGQDEDGELDEEQLEDGYVTIISHHVCGREVCRGSN